ncbi:MAG: glycosyltransferase family 2 protein [Gallionellaceae bacterium]|nr:glycosyltransferase family 2 protein [Gallionellaceae bacterium]
MRDISISVVSHLQGRLVKMLLADIEKFCKACSIELILTLNLHEELEFSPDSFSFPVRVVRNARAQGFATNHNQAFAHATGSVFCVVNPDIRLNDDPFPALLTCLQLSAVGVVAPVVTGENGALEDSARHFPTPFKILCKFFGGCSGGDYIVKDEIIFPDWVGGMFMLFPRRVFETLRGFDQRYFLYYEDVDLCARLGLHGYKVALCPDARVIHQARRDSHRQVKYLKWHLTSMLRFFCSASFLKIFCLRLLRKYPTGAT